MSETPDVDAEGAEVGDAGDLLALTDRGSDHRGDRGEHALPVGADMGPLQAAARSLPLAFEGLHLQLQGLQPGPRRLDQVAAVLFELLQLDAGALLLELGLAQLLPGNRADSLQLEVLGGAGLPALLVQFLQAPARLQVAEVFALLQLDPGALVLLERQLFRPFLDLEPRRVQVELDDRRSLRQQVPRFVQNPHETGADGAEEDLLEPGHHGAGSADRLLHGASLHLRGADAAGVDRRPDPAGQPDEEGNERGQSGQGNGLSA